MKILLITLLFILLFLGNVDPGLLPDNDTLESAFRRAGTATGIDWTLLRVIASVESDIRPHKIGDRGQSIGLMQVRKSTAKSYGIVGDDLFDPEINIMIGALYLRAMMDRFGFIGGIQAYALGETRYRAGKRAPAYFKKVWRLYGNDTRRMCGV